MRAVESRADGSLCFRIALMSLWCLFWSVRVSRINGTYNNNNLLHLYSAFLGTQSTLHNKGVSPHPPPVWPPHMATLLLSFLAHIHFLGDFKYGFAQKCHVLMRCKYLVKGTLIWTDTFDFCFHVDTVERANLLTIFLLLFFLLLLILRSAQSIKQKLGL